MLQKFSLYLPGGRIGLLEAVAVDFEGYAGPPSHHSAAFTDGGFADFGIAAEYLPHIIRYLAGTALTLALRAYVHVDRQDMGAVAAHRTQQVVGVRLTIGEVADADLRNFLDQFGVDAVRKLAGHALGRSHGQCHRHSDTVGIGLGEVLGLEPGGNENQHRHQYAEGSEDDSLTVGCGPADEACIPCGDGIQGLVDGSEEPLIELVLTLLPAKELGAEHGHQCKGGCGGHHHDDGHDPSELLEHHARHALDHGQGQEDAEHGKGGCDDGYTHFGGAVDGCLGGLLSPFDVGGHVLQHHDCIIHHHAYGQRQRSHRYDVQCVAGGKEVYHRSQQGDRDGKDDDEGRLPSAQEHEYHQHDHHESDEDGFDEGVDGIDDFVGGVEDLVDLDVRRKSLLYLLELPVHTATDVHGVGSGLLLDHYTGGAYAVGVGLLLTLLAAITDGRHVAQQDGLAAVVADHDVEQFGRIIELLLHTEGVGVGTDVDVSRREVAVFRGDYLGDGCHAQMVSLQLVGIAIHLYFAGGGSVDAHGTHALDTGERGGHLVVEYLVEAGHALGCRGGEHHDRHIVRAELEDHRGTGAVGHHGVDHVELVAHVIRGFLDVRPVFEFEGEYAHVLLALGTQFLEVLDTVQAVLQEFGEVGLDIGCVRAGVGTHHHDGVGVELREERDRGVHQGIETEDHEGDENQGSRHPVLYCRFDYAHGSTRLPRRPLRYAEPSRP